MTLRFDFWNAKHIYHLHGVYINSGIHITSYQRIKVNCVVKIKEASAIPCGAIVTNLGFTHTGMLDQ